MWCSPSPRFSRYFATGESGRVGREELHVGVGDAQERLFDAVALDHLAVRDLHAEGVAVVRDRRFEVVDGDGDVVDLGELVHA